MPSHTQGTSPRPEAKGRSLFLPRGAGPNPAPEWGTVWFTVGMELGAFASCLCLLRNLRESTVFVELSSLKPLLRVSNGSALESVASLGAG